LIYPIDGDITHFSLDEATLGFEQQLRRDMRFSATGIWRNWDNFSGSIIPQSTWEPFTVTNRLTNEPMTLYRWANRETTDEDYYITNFDGYTYRDPAGNVLGRADPKRSYKGLMLVLTKTYSNRWNGQFSYVWSEAKGTVGNTSRDGFGWGDWENPNLALIDRDGLMENDRTHEFKLMGGYQIPRIEVAVNAFYRGVSGPTYNAVARTSGSTMNWTGSEDINLEPRGSRRQEFNHNVDLRIEKVFRVDVHRFGIWMDVANLLNADTVTERQNRYPSRTVSSSFGSNVIAFDSPTATVPARQISFGARWSF